MSCKIILLHINYSQTHNNNDRPKLMKMLHQVAHKFLQVDNFDALQAQCSEKAKAKNGGIEFLQPAQIDLVMNTDSHLWYRNRCAQIASAVKQESEKDEQQSKDGESESRDEPELTTRVLRTRPNDDKSETQANKLPTIVPPIKIQL